MDPAMDCRPIQGVFPPHTQCSWQRLCSNSDPEQDNAVTDREWVIIIDNNSTLDKQGLTDLFQLALSTFVFLLWFDADWKLIYIWNIHRTHSQMQKRAETIWLVSSYAWKAFPLHWDAGTHLSTHTCLQCQQLPSGIQRGWKKHMSEASPASLSHWYYKSCSCCERLVTEMLCWCSNGASEHRLHPLNHHTI